MNFFKDKKGKEKRATVFDWINELFVGKRDWDGFKDVDKKKFSPFMVNRYLSMSEDFLPFVNYFQIVKWPTKELQGEHKDYNYHYYQMICY